MEEYSPGAFANRSEALPVIVFDEHDSSDPTSGATTPDRKKGRRERLRERGHVLKEKLSGATRRASGSGTSIQDRMLEKLLQQVIPVEDQSKNKDSSSRSEHHSQDFTERPSFNITTMSTNFRRFNARVGVVFVFQARMMHLMTWKTWSHTLSFLAVYTFVCLDPYSMAVLPLAVILLAILIPSFIARHPPPPTTLTLDQFAYSATGPPIAPAPTVKPASEFSKDFFRNMRDLQNSMEDFSRVHDKIISIITPSTNFSNEPLSSTIFLFTFTIGSAMFIASHLMPWRIFFLISGWFVTCLGHPAMQKKVIETHRTHIVPRGKQFKTILESWIARDIILDSAPETREVEIFELQKFSSSTEEWETWLFSPSPYDPLTPTRISGERPKGTRFFEDVQPPKGWEWDEKKWALDLWSREWVEERMITGVEVETEGERWVYDISYDDKDVPTGVIDTPSNGTRKSRVPSWEEGDEGTGRRGVWRRRRWVRIVKRRNLNKSGELSSL